MMVPKLTDTTKAIDLKSAVQQFHGVASKELKKLLRNSENFSLQVYTDKGSLIRIDMERLAWSLPLHLIALLVSPSGDELRLRYLLSGFRFLHSLSDLASRHTKLEQMFFEELKVTEQILDLVLYALIVLARHKQGRTVSNSLPLLHSALVACSFHLLTGYITSQWPDLALVLLAHSKVDVFMDVAFNAVRIDIEFLQIRLSTLNADILSNKTYPPAAEKAAHSICQQIEASLQFLQSLCQQKLFRERLLTNKELCKNGGILSLARAIMTLDILNFKESAKVAASVSRLKSKVLSILLQLCETESISYLDEVASSPRSMQLAKSISLQVLELLKTGFGRKQQLNDYFGNSCPSGLVLLNSMRLVDIFSDDSNFRFFITTNITHVLAEMLSLPHEEFLSSWCSTNVPPMEEDASLDYDPFVAAGAVLVSVSTNLGTSEPWKETNKECTLNLNSQPLVSYAQNRTSLLVKIIANLHCFVPNICEEQERNLFFNKFLECLQMELPKSSTGFLSTSNSQSAIIVSKNLGSLLDFATSLIPSYLNEEDVHLLSVFVKQLQSLISPQFEGDSVLEQVQDKKFKDSDAWNKLSESNNRENHQESQNRVGHTSPLSRKIDSKLLDVDTRQFDNLKEGTSESSLYQDEELVKKKARTEMTKNASESLRDVNKDIQNVETSGSDASSTGGKNSLDQVVYNELADHMKECALRGAEDNEKSEATNGEEKQQRKRKRNIMNDKQVTLIERALLDEPDMQRNAASLQSWADKLSVHGSDLTTSQLKNWLNNRKARLARSRGARALSEGENAFPDKPGGLGQGSFYDSPESPSDEFYVPPTTRRSSSQGASKVGTTFRPGSREAFEVGATDFVDFAAQQNMQINSFSSRYVRFEPGRFVILLDKEGKEIGKARVHQVEGRWYGKILEEEGVLVVDVIELKVERWTSLQHPSEEAGTTFDEAEFKLGVMRVAWDTNKMITLTQ